MIVNDEPTPFDTAAAVVLRGRAGTVVPALAAALGLGPNERDRNTSRSRNV